MFVSGYEAARVAIEILEKLTLIDGVVNELG